MPQVTSQEGLSTSPARRLSHAASRLEDACEALSGRPALNRDCVRAAVSEARYFAAEMCLALREITAEIDRRHGPPKLYPARPERSDHHLCCEECKTVAKGGKKCYSKS